MFDDSYFKSLSLELSAVKNRVRSFIQSNHWQTDGEWKESVLRTFLRRHLPKSVEIGRGFVITDSAPSKQIDVLIYCICLGERNFIRYWNLDPIKGNTLLDKWHAYDVPAKAPGYFLHNIIEEICPQSVSQNQSSWYPKEGKESFKVGEIELRGP